MKIRKSILEIALSLVIAVVSNPMNVSAEETVQIMQMVEVTAEEEGGIAYEGMDNFSNSQNMRGSTITAANLTVTPRTSEILIEVSTVCSFNATKVGVREVYVQEKVWYGWKTIAQAADYATNTTVYSGQTHCTNATKGKTYRVLCTHYAIESNGTEHTVANQSEEFVYN